MLDEQFTKDLQQYLDAPREERDFERGALLLLQLNRNRFMHAHLLRRRNWDKLEYELKKHLNIRLEGLTTREVQEMEKRELPRIRLSMEARRPILSTDKDFTGGTYKGRREDHDTLPADIQALYERNADLYFKMKQTFETLKTMEDQTACDRHELLTILVGLDKEYRANWNAYDTFGSKDTDPASETGEEPAEQTSVTPQQVNAARKYLSQNKTKIATLEGEEADTLLAKMQQRVNLLLSAGQTFAKEQQEELAALGLIFE